MVERSTATVMSIAGETEASKVGQQRRDPVDGLDDIGAWLAIENDENRRLAVGKAGIPQVLDRVDDLGDIGKPNGSFVAISDHQRSVLGRNRRLIVAVDLIAIVADIDRAFRAMRIGGRERCPHILEPDPVFGERAWIDLDAYRRQRAAADRDLADAVDLRQLLRQDSRGRVVEIATAEGVGGQREDENRGIRRVDLSIGGIGSQARGEVRARRVDRGLHVACCAVDVAVEPELQCDPRSADGAR